MNEESTMDFYSLIFEVTALEEKYEELQQQYNHYKFLSDNFFQDNKKKMSSIKYEFDTNYVKIKELNKLISQIQLDDTMKRYYSQYRKKKELIKRCWYYQSEIRFASSAIVYDHVCEGVVKEKLENDIKWFENIKSIAENKIQRINIKMITIYPGIIYNNEELIEKIV